MTAHPVCQNSWMRVISWSHAQTWNTPWRSAAIPQSSLAWPSWWPAGISPSAKAVSSNDLEEVVCWYHEKKNPSNTKIVQKACICSEETNSSANFNSRGIKPRDQFTLAWVTHTHTHTQEKLRVSNYPVISFCVKGDERGKTIHPGAGWSEGRHPVPHGFPPRFPRMWGLHTILTRPVGPGVWLLMLKAVIKVRSHFAPLTPGLSFAEALPWVIPSAMLSLQS